MKKTCLMILALIALCCLASCKDDGSADLCKALGSHDSQYVIEGDLHWLECQQEGCTYKTEPEAHSGGTATCNNKAKCAVCGALYGEYTEHDMKYVSDGDQTHTYRCTYQGCPFAYASQQHGGGTATCSAQARCESCDAPYGQLLPHSGGTPTCEAPAQCASCGASYGKAAGHSYVAKSDSCSIFDECSVCKHKLLKESNHVLASDGLTCEKCLANYFLVTMEFKLNEDGSSYSVYNGEKCLAQHVIVPAEYEGKPVTKIGEAAFFGHTTMLSIELPDTIKSIENSVFDGCLFKSITIPDSVEKIGEGAFSCCLELESVTFGAGLKTIGGSAFDSTALKRVVIPANVETVGDTAFIGCAQLEEVVIQDGVTSIGREAFAMCDKLKTVILPNTLADMGNNVFKDSPAIEYTIYEGMKYLGSATNPYLVLVGRNEGTRLVTHADTVFIMSHAFYNCENIVSVELGQNVRYIGPSALKGMDLLETITVHADNPYYYAVGNLLIDKSTNVPILGCKTSVIPSDGSIDKVNLDIFSYIASIKTIYIPKGIKTVGFDFQGMDGLKVIVLESDVVHLVIDGNYNGCDLKKENCFAVYRCHTTEQWKKVQVEYAFKKDTGNSGVSFGVIDCYGDYAMHYYYSEAEPTAKGNYWHYVDGVPTPWKTKE
ncbi:MAG: leucine-rich repeat protein [Clostridia bacterium]|nr:leucine-rich repeat protein [Clostridia bacterium]